MRPNLILKIFQNFTQVTVNQSNRSEVKTISNGDLSMLFANTNMSTPFFGVPVLFYGQKAGAEYVLHAIKTPNQMFSFQHYSDNIMLNIPYIYFLTVISGITASTYVFISYNAPYLSSKLFCPAISNIYDDARICWGTDENLCGTLSQTMLGQRDYSFIANIQNSFMNGIRNNDLVPLSVYEDAHEKIYENEEAFVAAPFVSRACSFRNPVVNISTFQSKQYFTIKDLIGAITQ